MTRTKRRGCTRQELSDAYREVKGDEKAKRARSNEIRETAWYLYNPSRPYTWRWWRLGFQTRFGQRVERADFTVIPGYDDLAQELASYFPEFAGEDATDTRGTARLWELLMSPYEAMPSKAVMMREAKRRLAEVKKQARAAALVSFEFGTESEVSF